MHRKKILLLVGLLSVFLSSRSLESRALVELFPYTKPSSVGSLLVRTWPRGWKYLPAVGLYIVDPQGEPFLRSLEEAGEVSAIEDESDIQIEALPSDSMISLETGVDPEEGQFIGLPGAWEIATGDSDVTVAVIDTGIDLSHPDLWENIWTNRHEIPDNGIDDDGNGYSDDVHGYNFISDTGDVMDDNGHGTHLAGIIGARGNNGIGIAGINWQVQILPLKFADDEGKGNSLLAIQAIDYAIRNGAKIINASWVITSNGPIPADSLFAKAIRKAGESGILFVTAAGNRFDPAGGVDIDQDPVYPASFHEPNILTVTALDEAGDLASFSNYGASTVDLAAPGTHVFSTLPGNRYGYRRGTSVATAYVSGSAALIASMNPQLTGEQIKSILIHSVSPQENLLDRISSGGSLNLKHSLENVRRGEVPLAEPAVRPLAQVLSRTSGGCSLIREE